jgi:hypothetical protein
MTTSSRAPLTRLGLALVLGAGAGCATQPAATSDAPFDELGRQFVHSIPFEIGETQVIGDDRIEILEVWGTRPIIEPGGDYLVVGQCHLASSDEGLVQLQLTTHNWHQPGQGSDLEKARVQRGDGRFVLHKTMPGPGDFHVALGNGPRVDSQRTVNVYICMGKSPQTGGGPSRGIPPSP